MQGKENGNVLSKRKCILNSREKRKKKEIECISLFFLIAGSNSIHASSLLITYWSHTKKHYLLLFDCDAC